MSLMKRCYGRTAMTLINLLNIFSNMAEAFAIIGLAAALLQFVDFGTKVVRRLRQLEDQAAESTACLKSVRNRLPLMLDLVKKIMLQMEAGLVSDRSKEVMYPVVQNCISQAQELDKLFNRSLPQPQDNSWIRGKKAICSVWNESEIERIDAGLKTNFELLVQAGTFQAITRSGGPSSISFAPTFAPTVQVTLEQQETRRRSMPWEESEKRAHGTQAVFMVPFPRDDNFLGRQDTINLLSETFKKCHSITLFGLGGIG